MTMRGDEGEDEDEEVVEMVLCSIVQEVRGLAGVSDLTVLWGIADDRRIRVWSCRVNKLIRLRGPENRRRRRRRRGFVRSLVRSFVRSFARPEAKGARDRERQLEDGRRRSEEGK